MNGATSDQIRQKFRTLWIIWGAILGSLLIYVLVCNVLGEVVRPGSASFSFLPTLRNIFYILAVLHLFLAFFLRKIMVSGEKAALSSGIPREKPGKKEQRVLAKYFSAVIITLALSESIAIFGLVLFMLGDSLQNFYFFTVVSALAILYHRPKAEEIEQLLPGKKLNA